MKTENDVPQNAGRELRTVGPEELARILEDHKT